MAPILRVHVPFLKISPSKVARREHDVSTYEAVHVRKTGTQPRVMSVSTSVDYHGVSALVRFTRPHTVLGTVTSVCSMTLLAASHVRIFDVFGILGQALLPAVFMNIAIVGLNQVYDKRIDMVNKPYLPMASGEFSSNTGLLLVSASTAVAFTWGALSESTALISTLLVSLVLGILYSVDLKMLRWKRFPLLAAGCILLVRALTVHVGFFLHASPQPINIIPPSLMHVVAVMTIYSIVIAIFKDLPDISGDAIHGIRTIGIQLGARSELDFTCARSDHKIGKNGILVVCFSIVSCSDLGGGAWFSQWLHT